MTITSYDNRRSYAGDGVTTAFVFPVPFVAATDLKVMTQIAGVEATKTLTTHYTVSSPPYTSGGTVTLLVAPAVGTTVFIIRAVPLTQALALLDGGPLPAASVNGAFDRVEMQVQRTYELATRSPILRDTDVMGSGQMDVGSNRLINVTAGVNPTDGANVAQMSAATVGPAGPAAWLPPVAWVNGLVCVVGPPATTVTYLGETYVCTTAHTAGASFNAANFVKVAQKGAAGAGTGDMLGANNLSDVASAATSRVNLGLVIGTNVQAFDAGLTELAAITAAVGDIIVGDGADSWAKLAVGTNNQVLTSNGTTPVWATPASSTGAVGPAGGLPTLTSGVPVLTSTVLAAGTVYYTPYVGQYCPIYDGTLMTMVDFGGQLSNVLANSAVGKAGPAAAANNSNYDLFIWNDAGTYRLTRGPAWTSDTGRGTGAGTTEYIFVQGVRLNANAITNGPAAQRGTLVASFRTNGTATCDFQFGALATGGTPGIIGLYSVFNRRSISMFAQDDTNSWNYSIATLRPSNNSSAMRHSFIQGLAEDAISARHIAYAANSSAAGGVTMTAGIGLDSTSAIAVGSSVGRSLNYNISTMTELVAHLEIPSTLGFHYVQALEHSTAIATTTWYGDNNTPTLLQNGIYITCRA